MPSPKILAFAGSTRKDSYNKKLVRLAAEAARKAGTDVTVVELNEFALPLFDQDFETASGPPEGATRLKKLMIEHDGFLISSPEYNSSISGVLKNAIDWASRPAPGEPSLVAFNGKVAALLAASPGQFGGLRGLVTLRSILGNINVIVLPDQVAIPGAATAFTADGKLTDPKQQEKVEKLAQKLTDVVNKLKADR